MFAVDLEGKIREKTPVLLMKVSGGGARSTVLPVPVKTLPSESTAAVPFLWAQLRQFPSLCLSRIDREPAQVRHA